MQGLSSNNQMKDNHKQFFILISNSLKKNHFQFVVTLRFLLFNIIFLHFLEIFGFAQEDSCLSYISQINSKKALAIDPIKCIFQQRWIYHRVLDSTFKHCQEGKILNRKINACNNKG
ncbi:unnamed protein product [Paramecium octaurelia]|uniref:Transmembrane protein n=1 Tax=Paramecium octaurelia TaxID=43137 RepID=A0A8S1W2S7_PAROT|nr:unnamed protein product [Paramecium octaurelia]